MRHLLGGMMQATHPITIVDMEAGLEHLSRGTARHVDTLLVVLEPYYKALEIAWRAAALGGELGVRRILGVANKIRDDADGEAVREFAAAHGLSIAVEVPFDDRIRKADLVGRSPIDVADSPAVAAISTLAAMLTAP
ncbi:MAG: hypothetical protein ABIX28_25030 [Vicinamibacterales bacterium]